MASERWILPPPLGQSNDLYEAYPQKADTVFDTFNSRFPDTTTNRVTSATTPNANPFGELPNVSAFDYSYLNMTQGANAANTPQSNWVPDPGNEASALQGNKFNNFLNTPSNAADTVMGNPLGTTNIGGIVDKVIAVAKEGATRGAIVFLGLVFIAGGLFLFAKDQGILPPMPGIKK